MRRLPGPLAPLCLLGLLACDPVKVAGDDDVTIDAAGSADAATGPDAPPPVACHSSADCSGGTVCDDTTHQCRDCAEHRECDSNVCDPVHPTCVPTDQVVYVDSANGSFDLSCGTKALPCQGLQTAVSKLTSQRSYLSLFGTFGSPKLAFTQSVTVIGYGAAVLDHSFSDGTRAPGIGVSNAGTSVVVDGLTVQNNSDDDGVYCEKGSLHLLHSRIVGNTGNGVAGVACAIEIDDSELSGNKQYGVSADRLILRSSLVAQNQRGGINTCSDGLDLRNNVIRDNSNANNYDGAIEIFCGSGTGMVAFNTFVGNGTNGFERGLIACGGQANLSVDSNIIFGNQPGASATVTQCPGLGKNVSDQNLNPSTIVVSDPRFVNPTGRDFHLQASSPARNVGTAANALPFDFDGTPRSDGQPDIGAFEAH